MPPALALVIYALGIVGLFRLSRDATSRTSPALWLPVVWLSIGASRNVGEWLGVAPVLGSPDQYLDGSPFDALVLAGLELAAVMVLVARHRRVGALLRANRPLLVFFIFCLISVVWSEYVFVASKRWTKAVGNLVMVMVVLSDPDPRAAVKRLLARTGFILIPMSIVLIKYYPALGRGFDPWTGRAFNMGVGMDKNALGIICLIFGLGSLWRVLWAFNSGDRRRASGPLLAHAIVLAMALWLLSIADSATSLGCFLVGAAFLVLPRWWRTARKPMAVHVLAVATVSVCVVGLFLDTDIGLVQAMGRDATLTTRTHLWDEVLRMGVNPLLGTGFESFWLGERARELWAKHWWRPNQAHNGYLEVFLNLGWVGVTLLALLIAWGYRNVIAALRRDTDLGSLRLAFFMAALLYNMTEAAFKVMHPVWIIFIFAVAATPRAARNESVQTYGNGVRPSSFTHEDFVQHHRGGSRPKPSCPPAVAQTLLNRKAES